MSETKGKHTPEYEAINKALMSLKGCALGYAADGDTRLMGMANEAANDGLISLHKLTESREQLVAALRAVANCRCEEGHTCVRIARELAEAALRAAGEDVE